jgi:hypothetical protein
VSSIQNPPTVLGKIEFLDIKQSLIDYLKKQSIFVGYEFEGSAMSTLMDLLAYNTYYYAFYSNMIASECFLDSAQRIESLISLTKPLGYTVQGRTCSRINVRVGGAGGNVIPRYSAFSGKNADGIQYIFYNLKDIPVIDSQTDEFTIYQAYEVVNLEVVDQIDLERQKVIIMDQDFDLDTVEVVVNNPTTSIDEIWSKIDNVGYSSTVEQKVYFIERLDAGFAISFGLVNSVGANITNDVRSVKVRYLKTNGSRANGISLFNSTVGGFVITTPGVVTSFGRDEPNIDHIKFLAPKWFAAQERAVTANDYKALVLEAGYFGNENEFNIFGGEELVPRRYGRVFVTSQKPVTQVTDLMNFIKSKSVITILPEYVSSIPLNVYVDMAFGYADGSTRSAQDRQTRINEIVSIFNERYAKDREYNLYFSSSDFINYVLSVYPELTMSVDDFSLYVEQTISANNTDYTFNLENELAIPENTIYPISLPFSSPLTSDLIKYHIDNSTAGQTDKKLVFRNSNNTPILTNVIAGTANITKGVVSVKSKIMTNSATFVIPFKSKTIRIGLNNLVTFNIKNITTY